MIDLSGKKFGRLTVVGFPTHKNGDSNLYWLCECDCGNAKFVSSKRLRNGITKSCGCLNSELVIKRNTKHNLSKDICHNGKRLYSIWKSMKSRCYNKNTIHYNDYGGRGITVCDEWKNDFKSFYDDMIRGYREGLMLDRIDNDGPYAPWNCRWVDYNIQSNNRRNNIKLNYNGKIYTVKELSEVFNISPSTIYSRYHRGLSIEDILKT